MKKDIVDASREPNNSDLDFLYSVLKNLPIFNAHIAEGWKSACFVQILKMLTITKTLQKIENYWCNLHLVKQEDRTAQVSNPMVELQVPIQGAL